MTEAKITFLEDETTTNKVEGSRNLDIEIPLLMKATGFDENSYKSLFYPVLKKILSEPGNNDKTKADKLHQFLCTMAELKPRDGLEGMLLGQMLITFQDAIKCLSQADQKRDYPDIFIRYQNQGIKLMRLYSHQLETLSKYRNKGKQKMTVKHVHLHPGSQAIIGEINHEGGGRDVHKK